jgi:hypothetical protein
VTVRTVSRSAFLVLPLVLAMTSPVGAETTVYLANYAVLVPPPLALLVGGLALLGVGGLIRKWRL